VGAKTGTAQITKTKSDLATFVCFAPYDKPEIVIAVVVEQGYKGTYAGRAAVEILNYYFGLNQPEDEQSTTEAP
jgi:penicillin-binding protein 2